MSPKYDTNRRPRPHADRGRRLDDDRRHDGRGRAQFARRRHASAESIGNRAVAAGTGRRVDGRDPADGLQRSERHAGLRTGRRRSRSPRRLSTTSTTTTAGTSRRPNTATARRSPTAPIGGSACTVSHVEPGKSHATTAGNRPRRQADPCHDRIRRQGVLAEQITPCVTNTDEAVKRMHLRRNQQIEPQRRRLHRRARHVADRRAAGAGCARGAAHAEPDARRLGRHPPGPAERQHGRRAGPADDEDRTPTGGPAIRTAIGSPTAAPAPAPARST